MTITFNDNLTWQLDDAGKLTISGNGDMRGCKKISWHSELIREVVIERGVTSIGANAFSNCKSLTTIRNWL